MIRGLFGGAVWGLVVGGSVSAVASLMGELPGESAPDASVLEVPAGSAFHGARADTAAQLPASVEGTPRSATPQVSAPAPEVSSGVDADAKAPAVAPETGGAQGALAAPSEGVAQGAVAVASEDPVYPNPQAVAPELPVNEADVSISSDPAQPAVPEVGAQQAFGSDGADAGPAVTVDVAQPESPVSQENAAPSIAPEPAPASQDPVEEAPQAGGPVVEVEVAETAPEQVEAPVVPAVAPEEAAQGEVAPEEVAALEPSVAPSVGLSNRAPNVVLNRLPTVGGDADAAEKAPERPLEAFATPYTNTENKPMFSVILQAKEGAVANLAALQNFQGALTIAVDAARSDATEVMTAARAAGFEVIAIADVPKGARPSDIEVAFEAYFTNVPEAVAILDGTGNGFRGDRRITTQVVERLVETGHGLVTFDAGLNAASQMAKRDGVPVKTVFRDIDGGGQNASVIRRFLDQAAFRAAQEKGVVMLGQLRAETISALLIWEQQSRAQSVSIAPLSAVLLDQ